MALRVVWFISTVVSFAHLSPLTLLEEEQHFKQWMFQHNKVYDPVEFRHRLHTFKENKKIIDRHNAGNHSFIMGLNQFSDMSFEEFRKFYLLTQPQNCSATKGGHVSRTHPNPRSKDWRRTGKVVTPVKNQGHCGSCWTFSTTGCLESVIAIQTGKLVPLSEQQLIDCAHAFKNYGCMGGLPSQAFEYIKYNKGLMTEEDYPYKGHEDSCCFKFSHAAAFVKDVVNITTLEIYQGIEELWIANIERLSKNDEAAMVDAVAWLNPVSFAFEVTADFMHYKEGVYTSKHCEKTADMVNHVVLAVGYGVEKDGMLYWIVKNSWGTAWGMDGYFLIERGQNMCGLATCASYPII